MQKLTIAMLGLALCVGTSSLMAQDEEKKNDFRNKLLEKYDKDGDGKLNEAEREAARAEFTKQAPATKPQDAPSRTRKPIEGGDNPQGRRGGPSREDMEARRAEFMKQFDKDGDGEISEEERAAMREQFEKRREEFRAEMLKKYDKDGDGEMSEEERNTARDDMRSKFQEITKKYDKDGSGRLEREEMEAAREAGALEGMPVPGGPGFGRRGPGGPGDEERRAEMMKRFDKDGDGELNEEERAALREEFGGRRGGPGQGGPEGRRGQGGRPGEGEGGRRRGPGGRPGEGEGRPERPRRPE
jgi:Ca2+-binding EF-hand superfamily protein